MQMSRKECLSVRFLCNHLPQASPLLLPASESHEYCSMDLRKRQRKVISSEEKDKDKQYKKGPNSLIIGNPECTNVLI